MSWRPIYFLGLLMLGLCGLFLLLIAFSSRAFAASNPITITYQTNAVHFPGSIDFTMQSLLHCTGMKIPMATTSILLERLLNITGNSRTVSITSTLSRRRIS